MHHLAQPATVPDAFATYVVPEIDVLRRAARGLVGREADVEDLVQETMLRAYRSIDRFDGRHPRAWLLTIMRNANVNLHRRRRPELLRNVDGAPDHHREVADHATPEHLLDLAFDTEIERALGRLPEIFRQVVDLVDIAGLSCAEAARTLAIPPGTVMSRLHRARGRMRDHLDEAR